MESQTDSPRGKDAEMDRYAQDYMRYRFPKGRDGACHTAFGDLEYSVSVDGDSLMRLEMVLEIFPEGWNKRFQEIPQQPQDGAAKLMYDASSGKITLTIEVRVKSNLEVLNMMDSTRMRVLGYGQDVRKAYREFLQNLEEEQNPSLRLMKTAAKKTMAQIYGES